MSSINWLIIQCQNLMRCLHTSRFVQPTIHKLHRVQFTTWSVCKDGRCVITSSHGTKVKPGYLGSGRCHLALAASFVRTANGTSRPYLWLQMMPPAISKSASVLGELSWRPSLCIVYEHTQQYYQHFSRAAAAVQVLCVGPPGRRSDTGSLRRVCNWWLKHFLCRCTENSQYSHFKSWNLGGFGHISFKIYTN